MNRYCPHPPLRSLFLRARGARTAGLCLVMLASLLFLLPTPLLVAQDTADGVVMPMDTMLRLRTAPTLESEVLDGLKPGTELTITGRTKDSQWLYVRTPDGQQGWVVSQFVTISLDPAQIPALVDETLPVPHYDLPPEVVTNIQTIWARGQLLGVHPNYFSKVGDSITVSRFFLQPIGYGVYNLGNRYQHLQMVIDHFSALEGRDGTSSFNNVSLAAGVGWTSDAVFQPRFATSGVCAYQETPLDCEYRVMRPAIALIMFGTNDTSLLSAETYEYNLSRILDATIANGTVPIISTIPTRIRYEFETGRINEVVIELARRYQVPLWDYGAAMQWLPGLGLDEDGVHPSIPAKGVNGTADFRDENLYAGYVIRNLTALQMLDAVWRSTLVDFPLPAGG